MAEEKPNKEELDKTLNLTGPEKAAIFLMSLGEEIAAKIFEYMDEREIQTIGNHMSALGDVDAQTMEEVRKIFHTTISSGSGGMGMGGVDFLKSALMKALDPEKAAEILNNISTPDDEVLEGGLETVRLLDPKTISNFLVNEHPQTAAIIMAHLEPAVASTVIKELPEENRMEVVHRLATLERVSPVIIRELDQALQNELRASAAVSGNKMGGVANAAHIMSALDRSSESQIMEEMDKVDKDLAEEIRNLQFTFEDINKLDENGIQLVLKEVNQNDLTLALKTASEILKEKIFTNMSERASEMMQDDLENMGPTKLSEVEKAQKKVVEVCKKLENEGKISTGGGAEDQYV